MHNKRKKYKLTNKLIAKIFKYKNEHSFNASPIKNEMLTSIDNLIDYIEQSIKNRI